MKNLEHEVVDDKVIHRILKLLKERGMSQYAFAKKIGVTPQMFTKWKYLGSRSYRSHINDIAVCLGTDPEYLLYGTWGKVGKRKLTEDEQAFLVLYQKLGRDEKDLVRETARSLVSSGEKTGREE